MNIAGMDLSALLDLLAENLAARLQRLPVAQTQLGAPVVTPRLLTVEQAASYLGRTKASVQHMVVSSSRLPVVKADRRVFLDVRDLDFWINQSNQEPTV
jgi:hypothetical protein